jgi:hypothetical protein
MNIFLNENPGIFFKDIFHLREIAKQTFCQKLSKFTYASSDSTGFLGLYFNSCK